MNKERVAMVSVLACICIFVAALLGYVNGITKDRIEAIANDKMQSAMEEIIPGAVFKEIPLPDTSKLDKAFFAVDEAGNKTAFCAKVTVSGFADDIVLIVGTDLNGSVTGVKITQINETAGLGSKTNDEAWLSQFKGLSGSINLKKVKTLPTDVAAVSGATISSSAVTGGVQTALDEAAVYLGGANDE